MSVAALALVLAPQAPVSNDVTAAFTAPEGVRVTLWAESPQLFNPTAIDVDAQGRVWVAEAVNYRKWRGRNPGLDHPEGDRIVVLEDKDGDGRAETSTVFAQDRDLVAPLGVAVIGDSVFVSCSPTIWRYRDRDGDLRADEKTVFLTGFGGHDHDHGAHSVVAGPDGRLWLAVGNAGPHVVTDASGFTLRSGSNYTGGGAETAPNRAGLVSDDGRKWTGGLILSVRPDGTDLRVFAHGFRNPYEVAIDALGNVYTADNDDDGNACCRLVPVLHGGDHGFFSDDGARTWQADRLPGQDVWRAHWHQDDPGVAPAGHRNGAGGPTGVCVYEGGRLPERFAGAVLNCDAGAGVVYAHHPRPDGSTLAFEREDLLRARTDLGARKKGWFRPSDVCVGADGAVWVADWYDPGVGGHGMGDREGYGRILRLARDDGHVTPRRTPDATAIARLAPRPILDLDALLERARTMPADDRFALEVFGLDARGREAEVYTALLAEHGKAPTQWPAGFAAVAWRLHPPVSVPAFLARAMAPELTAAERARAVSALAFVDEPAAVEAMLAVAESGPADAQALANGWLARLAESRWARFGLASRVGTLSREGAAEVLATGTMRDGSREVDAELDGARTLFLVVTDGGDGNGYDWASFGDLRLVGPAGELPLDAQPFLRASTGWGEIGRGRNAGGGRLAIGGKRFAHGIGAHAPAEIAIRLPEGYQRLRGTVGPDDGGTSQRGARTSLGIELWLAKPPDRSRFAAARATLADVRASLESRVAAARELAADRDGSNFLLEQALRGALDPAIRDAIAEAMRRHPDAGIRAVASKPFARPGSAADKLPPIAELAARRGDPQRGRAVFFGDKAQCAACHVHDLRGGALGPDLTRVGAKYDATGLLTAILEPSASIAFGYESWLVQTKDGNAVGGFLLADGPRLVLKDFAGARHVIDAEQIVRRERQPVSLMPDTAALGLDAGELVDLVAFLAARPFENLDLGDPIGLFDGRSLDGWTGHFPDGTPTSAVWSVQDGVLRNRGQPIGYLRTERAFRDFVLVVEWRFPGRRGNGGVLVRQSGPDKVWPRSIECQLESGNAGDIWNIDEFPMETAAERTEGRRTRRIAASSEHALGEWNRYEIVAHGDALRLTVNGVVQNEAFGCAHVAGPIVLQSEGAPMEFRRVEVREIRGDD
ncbi:MAG: family 16 glycoside hydrolase [Planctomycetota bacterium]